MEAKAFGLKQEKDRKNMWDILWLNCVMTRCLQNVISLGVNVLKKFWVLSHHLVGSISIILSRGFPKSGPMVWSWFSTDFCFFNRAQNKLEFQLVLWVGSSHILLAWNHFLLVLVNDLVRGWLAWTLAIGQVSFRSHCKIPKISPSMYKPPQI